MAQSKNITTTHQYVNNAPSPVALSITSEPTVSGDQLVVPANVVRPGVYTAGTPSEGYSNNVRASSNG